MVVSLVAIGVLPSPASASGPWYVATTGNDSNDCLSPGTACLTLNHAMNLASATGGTIYIASGTYLTPANLPQIAYNLTLIGADPTSTIIDGSGTYSMFHVITGIVSISNLIIKNGSPPSNANQGGGIWNESGGSTTLVSVTLQSNSAKTGGGIYNAGIMTLSSVTIASNGNTANNSTGGGIGNAGVMTATNVTINNNMAGQGGGIENDASGTMSLTNVTISSNVASFTRGGALNNANSASVTMMNVTINNNSAPSGATGGGIYNSGFVTLTNTIVANSTSGRNCAGAITSNGHNLSSDTYCTTFTASGDITNTPPLLGALALNSPGTTKTHALLYASPAINAGTNSGCPLTDQRGITRLVGLACDIGAYEFSQTNIRFFPIIAK